MIELELLGLSQGGESVMLNDAEGNRYVLAITDDLRAALRRDIKVEETGEKPKPMTPREIQAHFRAGLTVAEVSQLTNVPPSQLTALAYPIEAERAYTAESARKFKIGGEVGSMSLEEMALSRLVARGIDETRVSWTAYRDAGEPWTLSATYPVEGTERSALWRIDQRASSVHALNDEASSLSESQVNANISVWRHTNTPRSDAKVSALSAPDAPSPAKSALDIDDMLASLDSRRGTPSRMPSIDDDFDGAHPAPSAPEQATDARILRLPKRGTQEVPAAEAPKKDDAAPAKPAAPVAEAKTPAEPAAAKDAPAAKDEPAKQASAQESLPGIDEQPTAKPRSKRRARPAMPSWDEIVFGATKND